MITFVSKESEEVPLCLNLNDINDRAEEEEYDFGRPIITGDTKAGALVLVGDKQGALYRFSFPKGYLLEKIDAHPNEQNSALVLALSPDGTTLISAGGDGRFKRWKTDGTLVDTLELPFPSEPETDFGFVRRIDFTPDGKRLVVGCETGKIVVWDLEAKKAVAEMTEPEVPQTPGRLISRVYAIDHDRICSFCLNGHYRIWNLAKRDKNGVPVSVDFQPDSTKPILGIRSAAISPSRKQVVVADNKHKMFVLDTQDGRVMAKSEGLCKSRHSGYTISDAVYHPGGDRILAATNAYSPLLAFDPATMRVDREYVPYPDLTWQEFGKLKGLIHSIAVPETETQFAVALNSGDIQYYDMNDSSPKKTLSGVFSDEGIQKNDCYLITASPNGERLAATSSLGDEIILWKWNGEEEERRWKKKQISSELETERVLGNYTFALVFTSEKELLEIKYGGRFLRWDVETGELIAEHTVFRSVDTVSPFAIKVSRSSLSHDKKRLAIGFDDGTLAVLAIKDGTIEQMTNTLAQPLSNFSASPPQSDSLSTQQGGTVMNPERSVTGLAWSRDDSLLSVGFSSGKLVLAETRNFSVLATAVAGKRDAGAATGMFINTFFTNAGKLVTAGSDAVLRRWDFQPSEEKPTVLKTGYGADRLAAADSADRWAGVRDTSMCQYAFFYYDGEKELFHREHIEDFAPLPKTEAGERFLLLGKDGSLFVVNDKGENVEESSFLSSKNGKLVRIRISPDGRFWAGMNADGKVQLLDRQNVEKGWFDALTPKEEGRGKARYSFVQVAFRPDSRELAAVDGDGTLKFYSLETMRPVRVPNRITLTGPMVSYNQGAIAYSASGRFLIQTGASKYAVIWEAATGRLFQNIDLGQFERIVMENNSVSGLCILDRGFALEPADGEPGNGKSADKAPANGEPRDGESGDAFVVAGTDGVLRFYQYQNENDQFASVFVISPLNLGSLIKKEPYVGYNALKDFLPPGMTDEEAAQEIAKLEATLGNEEFNDYLAQLNEEDSPAERVGFSGPLISNDTLWVNALALGDDGQTLYVGASGEVRSYDMRAIRRRVENLPQWWKDRDIEAMTGLRYAADKGLSFVYRNYLAPVVQNDDSLENKGDMTAPIL